MSYNTMRAVETAIRPSPQELERRYRNYVEDMQPYYRWFGRLIAARPVQMLMYEDGSISTVDTLTPDERALLTEIARAVAKSNGLEPGELVL